MREKENIAAWFHENEIEVLRQAWAQDWGWKSPGRAYWRQPRAEGNCMTREGMWDGSQRANRSIERK